MVENNKIKIIVLKRLTMRWKTTTYIVITLCTLCNHQYNVQSIPHHKKNESFNEKFTQNAQTIDAIVLNERTNNVKLQTNPITDGKRLKGKNDNKEIEENIVNDTKGLLMKKHLKSRLSAQMVARTNGDNYDWNDPKNRFAPPSSGNVSTYKINNLRLTQIRSNFLYPFHDHGGIDDTGDYQSIHYSTAIIHKDLNFSLPFFGFTYNYTRISANGFLEFSDPPPHYTYPLKFPSRNWPKGNDPAFIGIFYSKCRIGKLTRKDVDLREPGVYFRIERDLNSRIDRYGVELRERLMWDIREGIIGSETFVPNYAVIVTWKNMTFAGGIQTALTKTNTFQLVLATDEVYTYAIFNYVDINWSSHTEAGGDTVHGEGGVPAYIGFNAGNGTRSFEYKPYSQSALQHLVTERGGANDFPGRHIFRIDEKILVGSCNQDTDATDSLLYIAPESGNMLGGEIVNITGPCFDTKTTVTCVFDTIEVQGVVLNRNRALCIQPFLTVQGYINLEVILGGNQHRKWRTKFYVETPDTANEKVSFESIDVYMKSPQEIKLRWQNGNLTLNSNANVQISLWGYNELGNKKLNYIDVLEESIVNAGRFMLILDKFKQRRNHDKITYEVGMIQINLTQPEVVSGIAINPALWSKPIPLAWYFNSQWELEYGEEWPDVLCDQWIERDRKMNLYANKLPICPCTINQALHDKGRFMPDFNCDTQDNATCLFNDNAKYCVKSVNLRPSDAEQQCCYDESGYLMLSHDSTGGSKPKRAHNFAQIPSLSQWTYDLAPFLSCCLWQNERSDGCEIYRFEQRCSQDCVAYQPPAIASIFGDPHILTFDGLEYTFNGLGEFVLLRDVNDSVAIHGRFEQVPRNSHGNVMATRLTAIALKAKDSAVVEVRVRPPNARNKYHLDIFLNGERTYFDRPSFKQQFLDSVTVYVPSNILNQSQIVIAIPNGIGIEVKEEFGYMAASVYVPWNYINKTRGLLGNFSWNMNDDFMLPNGNILELNPDNLEAIHKEFALKWLLNDMETQNIGKSLFLREYGRTSKFYTNETFKPNFEKEPFLSSNRTTHILIAHEICKNSYQCRYDYGMTLNNETAISTMLHYSNLLNVKEIYENRVVSCGALETPRFGKRSSLGFTPRTVVTFECNEGFTLIGDLELECTMQGRWSEGTHGYTECIRIGEYVARITSISLSVVILIAVPLSLILIIIAKKYFMKMGAEQEIIEEEKHWQHVEAMRLQQQEIFAARESHAKAETGVGDSAIEQPLQTERHIESQPSFMETPL